MKKSLIEQLEKQKGEHELLHALLLISNDDWNAAHNIAQKKEGELLYDRVHALLHRIEGDEWNARYWYKRVNQAYAKKSIGEEWNDLATEYLENLT